MVVIRIALKPPDFSTISTVFEAIHFETGLLNFWRFFFFDCQKFSTPALDFRTWTPVWLLKDPTPSGFLDGVFLVSARC